MLVSTMNIEALMKDAAGVGIFLGLVCTPRAEGGFVSELKPLSITTANPFPRVAASGSRLNWALINLDAVCERVLFEMKGKRKGQP